MTDDDPLDLLPTMPDQACAVATRVHRGQRDKAGLSYLLSHVADVARRVDPDDEEAVAVAWLHDVLEDTTGDPAELEAELRLRFPATVVDAVVALTYRKGEETRDEYYVRVKANPLALRVKLADIASNTDPLRMSLLDGQVRGRLAAKYQHALRVLGA